MRRDVSLAEEAGYVDLAAKIAAGEASSPATRSTPSTAARPSCWSTWAPTRSSRVSTSWAPTSVLDVKQNPMEEKSDLLTLDTHYYGGIKKYQWVTIPLELHGTVALKDGSTVDIAIGREPDEPQFVITDLLPHLGKDQMRKTMEEGITGEALNIVIGSMPYAGEGRDRGGSSPCCPCSMMNTASRKRILLSAELAAVPAFPARDIGFDRSMIGAYGQDDRVCAYAELRAILDLDGAPERTAVCILADKEEIGSDGVSGMQSQAFEAFMADLCEQQDVALRHCFARSFCLSADV